MKYNLLRLFNMTVFALGLALVLLPYLDAIAFSATGGTESTIPGYRVHTFTNTGSNAFVVTQSGFVEVLLVGGGGGGGNTIGGGGGGGGFIASNNFFVVGGSNYTVQVGAGGMGSPTSEGYLDKTTGGRRGENSSFAELVAYGGGGGRNYWSFLPNPYVAVGSGGGMGAGATEGPCLGTEGQGYAGGKGTGSAGNQGGGGGGAGASGQNGLAPGTPPGAAGGDGLASSITGVEAYYAGGGGGGTRTSPYGLGGPGGLGGGGAGSNWVGQAGLPNTGGGGGAGGYQANEGSVGRSGGDGGSGLVVIRYQTADSLTIVGSPQNFGTPTPPYGQTNELENGDVFLCSMPTGWFPVASGTQSACSGYQIFTNDVLASVGVTNECTYTHVSGSSATLLWLSRQQHEMTFSAGVGGTVSTAGGWYDEGSNVTVTATPNSHATFYRWTGDVPVGQEAQPTLSFSASQPRTITATFALMYYVSTNGSDSADGRSWETAKLTLESALAEAKTSDSVLVSNGIYTLTSQVAITNGVNVRSVNGAGHTFIHGGSVLERLVLLKHAEAVLDGFTIAKGTRGAVYIDAAGTLFNCVVSDNVNGLNSTWTGGGIYLNQGGLVKNCQIINNSITVSGGNGASAGGAYLYYGGTLDTCIISNNVVSYGSGMGHGGGVYMVGVGTRLKNCLITQNSHNKNASGVFNNSGTIESCTIVDNYCEPITAAAGLYNSNGKILNTIIAHNNNKNGRADYQNVGTTWSYSHCCTIPAVTGTGNTALDPQFRDRSAQDYRLRPGPCIDTGLNQAWMNDALDVAGGPRIIAGTVDMGALEYADGALLASFEGTPKEGFASAQVVFTAYASGTNTTDLTYAWSFNNDEITDIEGLGRSVVTNLYGSGLYSVRLTVSNAANETDTPVHEDYILVAPPIAYVTTNGASFYPYDSWAKAATNIHDAVAAGLDGTLVRVSNGVYRISSQIELLKNISVRSVNGAAATEIRRDSGSSRLFYVSGSEAVIDGFTLMNANLGAVYLDAGGTVSNCIIRDNSSLNLTTHGGGVRMQGGGLVKNCQIFNNIVNTSGGGGGDGGGIALYGGGGVIDSCIISNNTVTYGGGGAGGGVYMVGGQIRNSLIYNNRHIFNAGGIYCSGGVVENCTIVSNKCGKTTSTVGGLLCANATIRNTIIHDNWSTNSVFNTVNSGTTWSYNHCSTYPIDELVGSDNIDSDPIFKNLAAGDCRLKDGSPCINAGLYQPWMEGALDLAGEPRILNRVVDIGAYEGSRPKGSIIAVR